LVRVFKESNKAAGRRNHMILRDFNAVAIPDIIRIYSCKYSVEEDKFKELELFWGVWSDIPEELKDRYVLRMIARECLFDIEVT
jgi:hypothetical protein